MALPILPRTLPIIKPFSARTFILQKEQENADDHQRTRMLQSCNHATTENRVREEATNHAMQIESLNAIEDAVFREKEALELAKWYVSLYGPVYEATMHQSLPATFLVNLQDKIQSYIDNL